jgi:hypothetical protein
MAKKTQGTLAETRKALEPAWKCIGDRVADWVCPDGRRLGDLSGTEVGNLAEALMHKARLYLRHARRLARASRRVGAGAC